MTRRVAVTLLSLLVFPPTVLAGIYTDELSKCLVASTTPADRVMLARWIFIAFSAHPTVAPISNVKAADVETANAAVGDLFMKLLTDSCREKAKSAIKYEGPATVQLSFQVLGQVAGMELASSPDVQARMSGFSKHIDADKIKQLASEPETKPAN